jgi:hypothetical protein
MPRRRRSFPRKLGRAFKTLRQELINTHVRWALHRQVFGTEANVNLLNRFGGVFFGNVQLMSLDDMVLALCRLTDPGVQRRKRKRASYSVAALAARLEGKKPNYTLERLVALVAEDLQRRIKASKPEERPYLKAFGRDLASRLRSILNRRRQHFEKRRNKRIGHNDLRNLLAFWAGRPSAVIPSRQQIQEFLDEADALMNAVESYYTQSETWYAEPILPLGGGGDVLIDYLNEVAARIDAGEPFRPRRPPRPFPSP